jgi:O-antigen/teichoic acid export membrane protein
MPARSGAARRVGVFFLIGIVATAASQLAILFVARRLQPRTFGVFVLSSTVFSIILLVSDCGMQSLGVQQLSSRGMVDQLHLRYTRVSLRLATIVSAASLAGFVLVTIWPGSDYSAIPLLACAALPATFVGNMATKYRIRERFASASAAAEAVGVMALGALAGTILHASAVAASAGAVLAMFLLAALWWVLEPEERGDGAGLLLRGRTGALAWEGRYFLASALCVALYSRGDRVVVAVIAGRFEAGLYGVAYSLIFGASLLSSAIQSVTLPRLVVDWRDHVQWRMHVLRLIGCLWLVGLLGAVILVVVSDRLILVLFGSSFSPAAHLVRILSPLVPLYFVNVALGTCLMACGRERVLARITGVNLAVGLALYPTLTFALGAPGAAAASVAVEAGGHLMLLWALRPTLAALPEAGAR